MALYYFFLFRNGEVVGQTDCYCADDLGAWEVGRALSAHQTVEIYSKNRLVTRVQQAHEPLNVRTRKSG